MRRHDEDRLRRGQVRRPARELARPHRIVNEDRRAVAKVEGGHAPGGRHWSGRIGHRLPSTNAPPARAIPCERRVAMYDPSTMSVKPAAIPTVNGSWSSNTPSTSATAGVKYVMVVERIGPTSAIGAEKTRNAGAVRTTPRAT